MKSLGNPISRKGLWGFLLLKKSETDERLRLPRELDLAGLLMRQRQEKDHALAGVLARQRLAEGDPGAAILVAGEKTVAVDGAGERHRLALEGVDDVAVVDDVHAAPVAAAAGTLMGDDVGVAKEGFDAIVVDVDAQAMTDQPARRAVEHAAGLEAAGAGDRRDDLDEVGGAAFLSAAGDSAAG